MRISRNEDDPIKFLLQMFSSEQGLPKRGKGVGGGGELGKELMAHSDP